MPYFSEGTHSEEIPKKGPILAIQQRVALESVELGLPYKQKVALQKL